MSLVALTLKYEPFEILSIEEIQAILEAVKNYYALTNVQYPKQEQFQIYIKEKYPQFPQLQIDKVMDIIKCANNDPFMTEQTLAEDLRYVWTHKAMTQSLSSSSSSTINDLSQGLSQLNYDTTNTISNINISDISSSKSNRKNVKRTRYNFENDEPYKFVSYRSPDRYRSPHRKKRRIEKLIPSLEPDSDSSPSLDLKEEKSESLETPTSFKRTAAPKLKTFKKRRTKYKVQVNKKKIRKKLFRKDNKAKKKKRKKSNKKNNI